MADKYGRKIVMLLSIAGIAMAMAWVMLVCMQRSSYLYRGVF